MSKSVFICSFYTNRIRVLDLIIWGCIDLECITVNRECTVISIAISCYQCKTVQIRKRFIGNLKICDFGASHNILIERVCSNTDISWRFMPDYNFSFFWKEVLFGSDLIRQVIVKIFVYIGNCYWIVFKCIMSSPIYCKIFMCIVTN